MKLKIEIKMDNAAFGETDEERGGELGRILREFAEELEAGALPTGGVRSLFDINGNSVGKAKVQS